jgi:hypothetical protein
MRYRRDIRISYGVDHHAHAQAMVRAMVWYHEHSPKAAVTS